VDRREDERVSTSLQVNYENFDDFVVAYASDISQGGLFIDTEELLAEGSVVRLLLSLPSGGPTLRIIARVAHSVSDGERKGMGMDFLHVEGDPIAEQLRGYLTLNMGASVSISREKPATVLVVDDDAMFRDQAAMVMQRRGHNVTVASNGLEALGIALREPPDLILTDVEMPTMDGWQLLRMVRARPSLSHIPLIFMTKMSGEEERLKGYRLGVDDYIAKPFLFEELSVRVSRALSRSQTRKPSSSRNALRGDLSQVSLASVLQFVELEKRTGLLLIVDGNKLATLHVRAGNVVAVDTGGLSDEIGIERLFRVLDWGTGRFEFTTAEVSIADTINESTSYVLLEHSRRKDEGV
jgi:uncharacterized protein (TIGR02266 family)